MFVLLKPETHKGLKTPYEFLLKLNGEKCFFSQNDRQTESLSGQMVKLAVHCL